MTFPELFQACESALRQHGATVCMVVTATIALCTRYTGWSPKTLGAHWERVPALVLSIAVYVWVLAGESGLSLLTASTGLVCGILAGAGSNLTHDGLQAVGKTGVGKAGIALLLATAAGFTTGCAALATAAGLATGCPVATTPTRDQIVELCTKVAPLDPRVQQTLTHVPPEDQTTFIHTFCIITTEQLMKGYR